jgi:uncharacterized protein YjbI with pentapeptide repeats
MRRSIRRQLSFANVVSLLALFVALGGTSYSAVRLTGKDIKNGSLTGKDVKNRSLGRVDLSKKTVRSFKGARGTTGPQGPAGAPAATNAITGANIVNKSLTEADFAGAATNGAVSVSGVANGRCTQITFGIAGAQVGDIPLVITRAAIQNGVLFYANRVASAGRVEVNACNFSGGAMTAISGFPVRVVTLR